MTPLGRRAVDAAPAFDVAKVRARLPDPVGARPRQAAGLSRQRDHHPEAAGGARRDWTTTTGTRTRTSTAATHLLERARDGAVRGRAREGGGVHQRRRRARDRLHQGTTEGINLVAQSYGRSIARRRRRDRHLLARAPLEHRAVAAALRADGRDAARRADQRRAASSTSTRTTRCCRRARGSSRWPTCRTRSARSTRSREIDRAGARARRAWCWSTARRRRRTCRSTCRRSTATSTRSRATRCTARPASACSTARAALLEAMPPYQGGGDMIASVTFEKTTYNALPVQVRGRHAEHRRRRRLRRGDRLL